MTTSMPAIMPAQCRVAIVGAGPAGSTCALALASAGMTDIVLLEAQDFSSFRIGESVPPEMNRMLRSLDLEAAFLQQEHLPCYGSCSYWGSDKLGHNDSIMNPYGHGWHLHRNHFDRMLAEQASARGAYLLTSSRLISSSAKNQGFRLIVERDGITCTLDAHFVVDASGSRAVFARQRGSQKESDAPLICLAALLPWENVTRQGMSQLETTRDGWWYGAHLPAQQLLLALYSDSASIKAAQLQRPSNWLALLAQAPHSRQLLRESVSKPERLHSFPVASDCLDRLGGTNWLAIGDAASSWDPITSQGIIKAMANGKAAAQVVQAQLSMQEFADNIQILYQQYRQIRRQFYQREQRWSDTPFWQSQSGMFRN